MNSLNLKGFKRGLCLDELYAYVFFRPFWIQRWSPFAPNLVRYDVHCEVLVPLHSTDIDV